MRERSLARGIPQNDAASAEWPIASGIGGAEDRNDGDTEDGSEVERARISANVQTGAASERDKLGERTGDGPCCAVAAGFDSTGKRLFARAEVDERSKSPSRQLLSNG